MRCLRPCTPPVRLFSVYSLRVQPSIRQRSDRFPMPFSPILTSDLLDPKGNSYICLRSNGCHRYLRTAERLLTAAAEAKVASPRTMINFCELGGNHTDPNPTFLSRI
eukprot:scaffold13786_cov111-Isochrysis_galbana.AAC.5